jgi:methylated-DNA-protein-cysteine methyltransferase-like protein
LRYNPVKLHAQIGNCNRLPRSLWRIGVFTLPDPTPFYRIVWEIVRQIPAGAAATYGQIAAMIPPPEDVDPSDYVRLAPRWVGDAMNAVSRADDPSIPWHRVINAKGEISLPEDSVSAALQRARLRAERIMPDELERVDLEQFGWEGPDAAWLAEHGLIAPKSLKKPPDTPQQLKLF